MSQHAGTRRMWTASRVKVAMAGTAQHLSKVTSIVESFEVWKAIVRGIVVCQPLLGCRNIEAYVASALDCRHLAEESMLPSSCALS